MCRAGDHDKRDELLPDRYHAAMQTRRRRVSLDIIPKPAPTPNPLWRKTYLWLISLSGAGICIAVLAAALAPSPGHQVQPVGGVLGSLGLLFSIWIGWYASRIPLSGVRYAKLRLRQRKKARRIVRSNPALAAELGIGRPDLPRSFNDGGLVDANHAPTSLLASLPGIDLALAQRIAATREDVGGFISAADLEITLDLPPHVLSQAKHLLIFLTMYR